jgi:hypothetical protein
MPPLLSSIRKVKSSVPSVLRMPLLERTHSRDNTFYVPSMLRMPSESLTSAQNGVSWGNETFNKLVADNSKGMKGRSFEPSRAG